MTSRLMDITLVGMLVTAIAGGAIGLDGGVARVGAVAVSEPGPRPSAPSQDDWIQLFNGRDLSGWTPKITGYESGDNFGETFRVEGGLLKVAYDQYDDFAGRFGHLFYEQSFSHYLLRIEYRGAQSISARRAYGVPHHVGGRRASFFTTPRSPAGKMSGLPKPRIKERSRRTRPPVGNRQPGSSSGGRGADAAHRRPRRRWGRSVRGHLGESAPGPQTGEHDRDSRFEEGSLRRASRAASRSRPCPTG